MYLLRKETTIFTLIPLENYNALSSFFTNNMNEVTLRYRH